MGPFNNYIFTRVLAACICHRGLGPSIWPPSLFICSLTRGRQDGHEHLLPVVILRLYCYPLAHASHDINYGLSFLGAHTHTLYLYMPSYNQHFVWAQAKIVPFRGLKSTC